MTERIVSEKKVKPCPVCGEATTERITRKGRKYVVSVYHSSGKFVCVIKNNSEVEHLCLTNRR